MEPFPGNPDRAIRLDSIPFGKTISRGVFTPAEAAWIDTQVERVAENPATWVPTLMQHQEAHRILALDIGKLARGSVGMFGTRRGYPLRAGFAAKWAAYE